MMDTLETLKAVGFVGKTADGDRLWVEITLEPQTGREGQETTEHNPVPEQFYRLSVTGHGYYKGHTPRNRRDVDFAGQCWDTLVEIDQPERPWTHEQLADLHAIATAWHLNDITAGCAHQTPVYAEDQYGRSTPSLDLTPPCPETGYRYGHAWLTRVLPDDVLARVVAHMKRLDGTTGWPY